MQSEKILDLIASDRDIGELCDLQLVCCGQTIKVHKLIVCLQSPVIKSACLGPWKEAAGIYEIKDSSFDIVRRMTDYLYSGDYDYVSEEPSDRSETVAEPIVHAQMFSLADKYVIHGLLALSENKFRDAVRQEQSTCRLLRSVPHIYALKTKAAKVLRDIIIESVRERTAYPPLRAEIKQHLHELIESNPSFSADLVESYLDRPLLGHCLLCGRHEIVHVESLQCRCGKCGKGGASTLSLWNEGSAQPFDPGS